MKKILIFIFALCVFASCEKKQSENFNKDAAENITSYSTPANSAQSLSVMDSIQVKVAKDIKTASYRIEVENMDKSSEAIDSAVSRLGGVVSSANLVSNSYNIEHKISIRIPNENFEKLLREIGKHAVFTDFRNINSSNVAEEYVDVEARLKTKREAEKKYTEVLRKEARTIDQVYNAEDEIRKIHEEIEAQTSRLNYLRDQVAYSTINLELYQKAIFKEEPETFVEASSYKFKNAFLSGWNVLLAILVVIVYIWPILFLSGVLWFTRKYWLPFLKKYQFAKNKVRSDGDIIKRQVL